MQLNVLLFASYAEALGGTEVQVTLPDGASVRDLLAAVKRMVPQKGLPPAAVAVNHEYAATSRVLRLGDEVAIIPPVAGG